MKRRGDENELPLIKNGNEEWREKRSALPVDPERRTFSAEKTKGELTKCIKGIDAEGRERPLIFPGVQEVSRSSPRTEFAGQGRKSTIF